ncbi:hypothetical protein, partial [Halomonas sp. SL1]
MPRRSLAPLMTPLLLLPAAGQAAELALEPLTVSASRLERELYATPAAVSVVDEEQIAQGQP